MIFDDDTGDCLTIEPAGGDAGGWDVFSRDPRPAASAGAGRDRRCWLASYPTLDLACGAFPRAAILGHPTRRDLD